MLSVFLDGGRCKVLKHSRDNETYITYIAIMFRNAVEVRTALRPFVAKLPCVYLLALGPAKRLRMTQNWPELDDVAPERLVAKYGQTCDLRRRLREHQRKYRSYDVAMVAPVDPAFCLEAESALEAVFEDMGLLLPGPREITLLPDNPTDMKRIEKQVKDIGSHYSWAGNRARLRAEVFGKRHD
jgi:hypothetical protein